MDKTAALSGVVSQPSIPSIKAADFKVVYCNALRMGAGPYDVQFMFGMIQERNGPEDQVVEEQVMVIVSPQHARALMNSLRITLETYENNFGPIPDAAGAAAAVAAAQKSK